MTQLSDSTAASVKPTDLTLVFRGDSENVAWTTDVRLDAAERPLILFTVQKNDGDKKAHAHLGGADLRFMFACWEGGAWRVMQAAHAGSCLYAPEVDYTGLGVLHPTLPNVMFISTNARPDTGEPLVSAVTGRRV